MPKIPKAREVTLAMGYFPWKLQSEQKAPTDVPIVAMSPTGIINVFLGRELLDWSRWLTLDEFSAFAHEQCRGPKLMG